MALIGFGPYCGLWHGDAPTKCTDVILTSGGMMCALGLAVLALQPVYSHLLGSAVFRDLFLAR